MSKRYFEPPWPEAAGRAARSPPSDVAGVIRGLFRLISLFLCLAAITADAAASGLVPAPAAGRRIGAVAGRRRRYCGLLLRVMGARLETIGRPPAGAALIAANHHSWLDALTLSAAAAPAFVAYARAWPVIGFLMSRLGTVEIGRGASRGLPAVVEAVARLLRSGDRVAVFPEATTSFGPDPLEFKGAFFQAAIDAGVPTVPAAIVYATDEPWPSPERVLHWVSWTPFPVHAFRILCLPRFRVVIAFGSQLAAEEPPSTIGSESSAECSRSVDRKAQATATRRSVIGLQSVARAKIASRASR